MSAEPVPWVTPTKHLDGPPPEPEVPDTLRAVMLAESLRDRILMGAAMSPRSLQVTIGASEIGGECARQIAYRAVGTAPVNFPDPLKSLIGIGGHHAMADLFKRIDAGTGRYLIEEPLSYKGIPGTCDLYDKVRRMVIDWKWSTKAKVRDVRRNGPPKKYVVQGMIYGAALVERGDPVETVAIVYLPTNGDLPDLHVWSTPFRQAEADKAIEEFWDVRDVALDKGPDAVQPHPTRLCPWCSHYQPTSTDPARACPDGYRKEDR